MKIALPLFAPLLACALLLTTAGCASLPPRPERTPTHALVDTTGTTLGRALAPAAAAHPGDTGVHPLPGGGEAFAARFLLAQAAERSLDLQYYIWHGDTSGALLSRALWDAAERGVRVRLLLDDANTQGEDDTLATLDGHPNIEVRLFNPFASRAWRVGDYAIDFARLNRRMHNKAFIADNQVAIVGGRNIGDEYLGVDSPVAFMDLDVIAAGSVVREVSQAFDAYWNSAPAYPASAIVPAATPDTVARVLAGWEALRASPQAERYIDALRDLPLVPQMLAGTLPLDWVPARLLDDDPAKVLNPPERSDLQMLPRLENALGRPQRELLLVSPYFVPTREGTAALVAIAQRGVQVRVLTNSLAATDVSPVYAGYAKYRQDLLRGGVRLYELKARAAATGEAHAAGASLHAKTFAVDRERIFVGSFNLDPRSQRLNTEMGVLLQSAALAARLSQAFDETIPLQAYEVCLAGDGDRVEWIERSAAGERHHASAPEAGLLRRIWAGLLSMLPIEWLL